MPKKGRFSRQAALLFCLFITAAAPAQQISGLAVFGDNIADPGNIPRYLSAANAAGLGPFDANFPPSPPYAGGRFSNGPVAPEYLAGVLGVAPGSVANLAVGNAFSDQLPVILAGGVLIGSGSAIPGPIGRGLFPLNGTDVSSQVRQYLSLVPNPGADDLMVVYASANDGALALNTAALLQLPPDQASLVIQGGALANAVNTAASARALIDAGARQVVLVNLPDIGRTPAAAAGGLSGIAAGTAFSLLTNQALAAAAQGLNDQTPAVVSVFDAFSLLADIVANPGKYGLSDVTNPCLLVAECAANPALADTFLFWDPFYPTTAVHAITAAALADTVNAPKTLAAQAEVGRYGAERFVQGLLSAPVAERNGAYALVERLDWSRDGETFSFGYDSQLTRITLGVQHQGADGVRLGAALAVDRGDVDLNGLPAEFDFDSERIGLRAGLVREAWSADLLLAASQDDYDDISRVTGVAGQVARAQTSGDTFSAVAQAAWHLGGGDWAWHPLLRLGYTEADVDAYDETGAVALAQSVAGREAQSTWGELGIQFLRATDQRLRPSAALYYRAEISGDAQVVDSRLVSLREVTRSLHLTAPDDDYLRLELGLDWRVSDALDVGLHAQAANGAARLDGWSAGLRMDYRW